MVGPGTLMTLGLLKIENLFRHEAKTERGGEIYHNLGLVVEYGP